MFRPAQVSQIERGDVSSQDVLNRYLSVLGGTLKVAGLRRGSCQCDFLGGDHDAVALEARGSMVITPGWLGG